MQLFEIHSRFILNRNWYIAATSVQKDIVIAIDISAQMGTKTLDDENLLTVAKKLVKIIVRTLLYSDHVSMHLSVSFSAFT